MDKRFSWIFLVASGAFFVFVVGFTGYRIDEARRVNAAAARERLPVLSQKALSLRGAAGGFNTPQFKKGMRAVFDAEPRLLLLSIHSQDGMLYLVTRNKAFLREPGEVTPDWRGTPSYVVSKGYEVLLSTSLDGSAAGGGSGGAPGGAAGATMDTLSVIMGRDDLYPVVRDDLYLFLAFLFVCGVLMLIVIGAQQEPVPGRAAPADTPIPRASSPAPGVPAEPLAGPGSARALASPRTGLVWADLLEARLRSELDRAAAADQDLACARLRIDGPFTGGTLSTVHAEIAKTLKNVFPLQDLIFESGEDSYTIVLPDTGVDPAVRLLDELRAQVSAAAIEGRTRSLSIGVSARGGRLIEHTTILEEAETALAKASREGGNQVIGFRANAARFRDSLAGSVT